MESSIHPNKPVLGITTGDINGIGIELIIKTFSDNRMTEICTPVIFASNKTINFYRKMAPAEESAFNYQNIKDFSKINVRQVNVFNCWEEELVINPGVINETGGKYAIRSLVVCTQCLKDRQIDGMVTGPVHKKNMQSQDFRYTGHTPFLKEFFGTRDVLMLMVSEGLRVGLVTEHIPLGEVKKTLGTEIILSKLQIMKESLIRDFGIAGPKIAILALNPHAGDEGLIGDEEKTIIAPAIQLAKQSNILCFGPYSADAFFARQMHHQFDAVLAMYHDQGLIPFKSLAPAPGVNYTAGLPVVRTSPDHGTAFDIAGKNIADESSFRQAIFTCVDIINQRKNFQENTKNPLKKVEIAAE
ncbi:MAG TPA: 4-hydroxythreonine-4-phosphate dehydrogenase PdxA [Chitinophagaceae bacterium]|nr:4-hydroxythreonine-4-phosphate dehydrogenase PdxA [Chitinophagaceae bacterium]